MKQLFGPVHFGSDQEPGIRRRGAKRFIYIDERTKRAPSARDLERIRVLAVPPAWSDVWIAADAGSHLQAAGRDARGRKQYRYHPAFTESQSENKFGDLVSFAQVLGSLRSRVTRDLGREDLSHDRVVATVVRLLDVTSLRVGNVEYAHANRSFGLTTLRNRHVAVRGTRIRFTFRGKSAHDFDVLVDVAPVEHDHVLAAPCELERDEAAGDAAPDDHDVAADIAEQWGMHREQAVASLPEGVTIMQVHGWSSIRRLWMRRPRRRTAAAAT